MPTGSGSSGCVSTWACPGTQNPTPERLRKENDQVLEALARFPDRLFGFAYVSGEHPEASLAEIDRCVRDGPMVGIKLWVAKHCNAPELDPIIDRAAALKAVIFQHTWIKTDGTTYPGESSPDDLVALAKRHPGVPLICGHTGGTWELGIRTVREYKQISIDLAGLGPDERVRRDGGPRAGGRSGSSTAATPGAGASRRSSRRSTEPTCPTSMPGD